MNRLQPLSAQQNFKSNSTSSIWCNGTISEPNMLELVGSVSTMLHCFPESDTRILTNRGFLFLEEVEHHLQASSSSLLFACFDARLNQIVYRPGNLVITSTNSSLIEMSSVNDKQLWNVAQEAENSLFGENQMIQNSQSKKGEEDHLKISIRMSHNHQLFVQKGLISKSGSEINWKSSEGQAAAFSKVSAASLVSSYTSVDSRLCVRLLTSATQGVNNQPITSSLAPTLAAASSRIQIETQLSLDHSDNQWNAFLHIYAYWLAGAAFASSFSGTNSNSIILLTSYQENAAYLLNLLSSCGLSAQDWKLEHNRVSISSTRWSNLFSQSIASSSVFVSALPLWILFELNTEQTRLFLRAYHRAQQSPSNSLSFTNAFLADDFLRLTLHAGFTASIQVSSASNHWVLSWSENETKLQSDAVQSAHQPILKCCEAFRYVPYLEEKDGRIWCVEVEHDDHLILVQRALRTTPFVYSSVTSTTAASASLRVPVHQQSRPLIIGNCQMMRDLEASEKQKKMLPYFCEELYTGKVVKSIPSVKEISHFLRQVFEVGQFHPECCVISLVYINRLIGVTSIPLTQSNWKPIAISALVLAQKVWDDTPLINADFSILYPALTVKEINFLERQFLHLLEFKLAVSPSLYAQYYFELRSICEENQSQASTSGQPNANAPVAAASSDQANLRGLSKYTLKRVEIRSHLSEEYQKDKQAYKKRSMTIEDIAAKFDRPCIS